MKLKNARVQKKRYIPVMMGCAKKVMDEIGVSRIVDEAVKWDAAQWFASPGELSKAMVYSTMNAVRTPLYLIDKQFENLDGDFLIGKDIDETYLNDDALGRTLDRIGEANPDLLFQKVAMNAIAQYRIAFSRIHSDTTSVSLYGAYEGDEFIKTKDGKLQLVRGYNKDHRPECNQLIYGQMTTEHGIPLLTKTMNGNTSDVEYNQLAVKMAADLFKSFGNASGVYIADSKLMTGDNLHLMMSDEVKIRFISRVPANFDKRLEERIVTKSYHEEAAWEYIGVLAENETEGACEYWIQQWKEAVHGYPMNLVCVKSSAGMQRVSRKVSKLTERMQDGIKDLEKKVFACRADAEKDFVGFSKSQKNCLHILEPEYHETKHINRGRGRPAKNAESTKTRSEWRVQVIDKGIDADAYSRFVQAEEAFVLATNDCEMDGRTVLEQYKGQMVVENEFRALKEPALVKAVFLKKPERVQALMFIVSVSLLVRALIQYRLRRGVKELTGERPRVGRNGGKLQDNPTYNFLSDELRYINFIRTSKNACELLTPNEKALEQTKTLMRLLGYELEELLN